MRLARVMMRRTSRAVHMFGDCDNCGHSVAYHAPLMGCLKCSCDEFK